MLQCIGQSVFVKKVQVTIGYSTSIHYVCDRTCLCWQTLIGCKFPVLSIYYRQKKWHKNRCSTVSLGKCIKPAKSLRFNDGSSLLLHQCVIPPLWKGPNHVIYKLSKSVRKVKFFAEYTIVQFMISQFYYTNNSWKER